MLILKRSQIDVLEKNMVALRAYQSPLPTQFVGKNCSFLFHFGPFHALISSIVVNKYMFTLRESRSFAIARVHSFPIITNLENK